MKGSVGEKLRKSIARFWFWFRLAGTVYDPINLLVAVFNFVFRMLWIVLISPLVAVLKGVFHMLRIVVQGAWCFVSEAIPAMFKSRTVASPAFKKASRRAHWGAVFYILQYLVFLDLVKLGFVVGWPGLILTWYAILVMSMPMERYLSLLVGLYQFYCRRKNRLPESDVEWQNILESANKSFRGGVVIRIVSIVTATPIAVVLAALLNVPELLQFTLIQIVQIYLSNKIGVNTTTFWTGLSSRRPGVISKETPYGLLAAKIWRRALCWWVVPTWQVAVLTGSSGAWPGPAGLGIDPADLVKAVTPDGYEHPVTKLFGRMHGELRDVASAARTARRNRQYGRSAGLQSRRLRTLLKLMLLQPLSQVSIRSVRWLLPKRKNAELQSRMRRVRVAHVLGVILLFTPVMLFLLARGVVAHHKSWFMILSAVAAQVAIKCMTEEGSGNVYELAEYGQWPSDEEAEMRVFKTAWNLVVTGLPDAAVNIGSSQGGATCSTG